MKLQGLSRQFFIAFGVTSLLLSPYPLERLTIKPYFVFDVYSGFLLSFLVGFAFQFAVIFLAMRFIPRLPGAQRVINLIIIAILMMFSIRGILLAGGYSSLMLANDVALLFNRSGLEFINVAVVKRIGVFCVFGVILLSVRGFDTPKKQQKMFISFSVFGIALLLILASRVIPVLASDYEFGNQRLREVLTDEGAPQINNKRVIFVIFDELDYQRAFNRKDSEIKLSNIKKLQSQSISFSNAVSPAWTTLVSIPALITGERILKAVPTGPASLLLSREADNSDIQFSETNNLFSRLHNKKLHTSILGFYHPYCNIFPYIQRCYSLSIFNYMSWWWGNWQSIRAIPGVDALFRNFSFTHNGFNETTKIQLGKMNEYLSDHASLVYIHFNFPHFPGGRVSGIPQVDSLVAQSGYDKNLMLVDWTIGEIMHQLNELAGSQDVLLIITSDHWLRTGLHKSEMSKAQFLDEVGRDGREYAQVPLIISRIREKRAVTISQKISTINIGKFIEEYLSGNLEDSNQIRNWWIASPYIEPLFQDSKE